MDRSLIKTEIKDNILVVYFEAPALSGSVFNELNDVLDEIERCDYDGVVFTSRNKKIFLAGADLFELNKLISEQQTSSLKSVIHTGQETYKRIEDLHIPTVAAINGICLGGGYELALACDHIICSNDRSAKVGLPEVTLGILPAWGGTTRIIRRISLPNAMKVLLTGSQFAAKPALKLGLVDKLVYREHLIDTGIKLITSNTKAPKKTAPLIHRLLPASIVLKRCRSNVQKKTLGNYPAPNVIIDTVSKSLDTTDIKSYELEVDAFLKLSKTKEMHNLLKIFFLQEESKKLKVTDTKYAVTDAVVIGAGVMGAGIAQWASSRGINVLLKDIKDEYVANGLKRIGDLYVQGVLSHKLDRPSARDGLARVSGSTKDIPLYNKDLIIEAVVEKLDVKQKLFEDLEKSISPDTILATNTSALSIDEMASNLKHPERFVGIHFFNPVHKMKLVEVVRGKYTSDETVQRAVSFVQQIGKLPVVVTDRPGFVVNRVLVPYLARAAELLYSGSQMEAIDKAMVKFGMPMGPFRLMDEIGIDVCYHVATDLRNRLGLSYNLDELEYRMSENKLGKKTGEGFYRYEKGRSVKSKVTETVDVTSLIAAMTTEAEKIVNEEVAPGRMIDFAMIMGTGWAPFHGGPLNYAFNHQHKKQLECHL